jgi:hypothetical protein
MANLSVKDSAGATRYLKAAGAGTDGDPFVLDRTTTLSAGTAAIGKLGANSGVDIGDVTINNTAGSPVYIAPGTAVNLDTSAVTVTGALPAGTNAIGQVYGGGIVIAVTPTITAGAYTAKDAVGGKLTFANAARVSGGKGIINSLTLVDHDDEKAALELWLYNQDFTAVNDNAAFDPSDADNLNLVGVIPITTADYFSANDNGVACVRGVGLQFQLAGTTSMYGQLKCIGTPSYTAASDLTVKLAIEYID